MSRPHGLRLRELAFTDIEDATRWYAVHAGATVAAAFATSVEQALQSILVHPEAGSPRWSTLLQLDGLRCRRLQRFPYLLFYRNMSSGIEVWRLLHAARDIPASIDSLRLDAD